MWEMETWQWITISAVAVANLWWIGAATVRMFSRKAATPGEIRKATAYESGIADAERPPEATAFDAFSYRVSARFAGRVRIVIYPDRVAVAGPRTPKGLYRFWMRLQGLLLALAPAALAAAVVNLDWRWLVLGIALSRFCHGLSPLPCAGWWPGLGETGNTQRGPLQSRRVSQNSRERCEDWHRLV